MKRTGSKNRIQQLIYQNEEVFNKRYNKIQDTYSAFTDSDLIRKERYLSYQRTHFLLWSKCILTVSMAFLLLAMGLDILAMNQGITWVELNKMSATLTMLPFMLILLFTAYVFFECALSVRERLNVIIDVKALRNEHMTEF